MDTPSLGWGESMVADAEVQDLPPDLGQWRDPYGFLSRIRETGPVRRVRTRGGWPAWLVTRYEDVIAALAEPNLSSDPASMHSGMRANARRGRQLARSMITSDPPDHTRLRGVVSRAFTARRIAALQPRVEQVTDALLDNLARRGTADLVADFAFPLPVTVIGELLGVPPADRDQFRAWSGILLKPPVDDASLAATETARTQLWEYLDDLLQRKRREPGEDLLTALLTANDERELSDIELVGTASLLLIAGHETTVNLIGSGTLLLLEHPEQRARLRSDPAMISLAVEEFLRFDGPIMLGLQRYALEDVELGGVRIRAGEVLVIATGAANRDPAQFDRPDTLDLGRADNAHVAFGRGVHFCLGAALARLEGQVAIGRLFQRFPDLALAVPVDELRWRPSLVRGLESLPVTVGGHQPADG